MPSVYLLFVYLLLMVEYFDFAGLENGNIIIYESIITIITLI